MKIDKIDEFKCKWDEITGKCKNVLDRNESNAESAALWWPIVKLN